MQSLYHDLIPNFTVLILNCNFTWMQMRNSIVLLTSSNEKFLEHPTGMEIQKSRLNRENRPTDAILFLTVAYMDR